MTPASEVDPYLGEAIRRARERKQMTQVELGKAVGVDRKTVDNWENGRTSPRNRLGALEEVLNVAHLGRRAREIRAQSEKEIVGGERQGRAVYRRRDEAALIDAVRELGRGLEQTARGIEAAQRAAAAIAAELEADDE